MGKMGAPKDANKRLLCCECSSVKERRRCSRCDACSLRYAKEKDAERQRVRGHSRKTLRERKHRYAGLVATRPSPQHCEICQREDFNRRQQTPRALALDHCHKTGKFRGWLCLKCNLAIAHFGDTREGVQRAVDYFNRAEKENE